MTDKAATEAVARAIAIEVYGSAIAIVGGSTDEWKPAHMAVMPIAEAGISAYRQHLADEGMAIVSSEPTFQQMLRGADSGRLKHCNPTCDEARTIYRAMISAHDCTKTPDAL